MAKEANRKKKKKDTGLKTKLSFERENEELSELDARGEDFDEGGILLDKESVWIMYHALREYTPTEKEEHLHGILLEEFEEILVAEYGEAYPDAN